MGETREDSWRRADYPPALSLTMQPLLLRELGLLLITTRRDWLGATSEKLDQDRLRVLAKSAPHIYPAPALRLHFSQQ